MVIGWEPRFGQRPVLSQQRHHVGDGPDRHQLEELFLAHYGAAAPGAATPSRDNGDEVHHVRS